MKQSDHPMRTWRKGQTPAVTLTALAANLGVSPSHLSEIENWNNEPSLELADRLSSLTGLDMRDFRKPKAAPSEQESAA